jgi:uncharacterized protein YegJ (DUF2314 family)
MTDEPGERGLPWTGWVGIGLLVLVLAGLVVWSIPKSDGAAPAPTESVTASATTAPPPKEAPSSEKLERLGEAICELAVLTDKPENEVEALANVDAIAKRLDVRHCGSVCDVAKRAMTDTHFELDVMKSDDFILPPREAFDAIAPGLTKEERDRAAKMPFTLVVKARGAPTADQLPARACISAAAAAADALNGFVYDEAVRRIETPAEVAEHAIKVPAGQNVFTPRQIAIQIYRQDDGTARLMTLGMARFGSPDFIVRGTTMAASGALANVLNAVCARQAAGPTPLPVPISLDDLARVAGRKPSELVADPSTSKPISLQAIDAERAEGDPDNDILELVPAGGDTPEAWSAAVASLTGESPDIMLAANDTELQRIAASARRDLPGAIKRFEAREGALYVKGPFPIPGKDGREWMWVEVSSCDKTGCSGVLSNDPGYATNLAQGKPVRIARDETADWVLRLKDGGTVGGASIRVLSQRSKHP